MINLKNNREGANLINKKEYPEKPTKIDVNELNELIIKKEIGIDRELFKNILTLKLQLQYENIFPI